MSGGFKLSRTQSQGDLTGKMFQYQVDAAHATLLAPGDAVVIQAAGADTEGNPLVDAAVAAGPITGILYGVNPNFSGEQLSESGLPASTAGSVLVNNDPSALYEVDVSGGAIPVANVGLNIDLVATAATKTGGLTISNMTVDSTTAAATVTLPFRIVALKEDSAGVLGNVALVRVNASTVLPGAVGV